MKLKRFIDNHDTKYDQFTLSLDAGSIGEDGIIGYQQLGILDTFSIGMPIYTYDNEYIGRLSVGLFKNLNYSKKTTDGLDIPVECWRVDGYKGKPQKIKTYHQLQTNQ